MYRSIFHKIKRIVPKISETELIALRSGSTSLDRQIFEGKVQLPNIKPQVLSNRKVNTFEVDILLQKYGKQVVYPNFKYPEIFKNLGDNKYFSYIIDEKYGGKNLSVSELSSILVRISSQNPALGVSVMVPNSLGPGELLQEYGTETQKNKYLPGLANGKYIPCFGLTGPENGSDAAGKIDTGVLKLKNGKRVIELEINKRYITLAPVANLIGLGFRLEDPDNLLEAGNPGITVALLDGDHPGLESPTYHNPLNAGFPNGTLKGKLEIDLDQVVGGEENVGLGWKMLMECLAAGRAVCLPGTALSSSKVATWGVYNFSKHRKQFGIPLIKMEGVNEKWLDMLYHTWVIQSSVNLTNVLLEQGDKPAVISALMKQQCTERARKVINNGMDIHAGNAICLGHSNFLHKYYQSVPIGITVEGSNTLTRSLIVFGQGLNKSHPYIFPILESILEDNPKDFQKEFNKMVGHTVGQYIKTYNSFLPELEKQTIIFASLANFLALKGGNLKKEQYLSGLVADYFSNIYLAYSVQWYQEQFQVSDVLSQYCIDRLMSENRMTLQNILSNEPKLATLFWHLPKQTNNISFEKRRKVLQEVSENSKIMEHLKQDLYLQNNILEDLDKLESYPEESLEYDKIYQRVINVGEYKNI